jgi:hypothetical protein
MRRRGAVLLALLGLALAWWVWPAPEPEVVARVVKVKGERKVSPFEQRLAAARARAAQAPPAPEVVDVEPVEDPDADACDLCASGVMTGEFCDVVCGVFDGVELVVDVVDEAGRPEDRARVTVNGCVVRGASDGVFRVEPGTCVVQAWRRDGSLLARSDEVVVNVEPGDAPYVQLELESTRTGGLGVSIMPSDDGIRVVAVVPGSPAAELGLQPGDVILQVDGVDTLELDMQGFIQTMTGPEGTDVDFVVRYPDGEEEALAITRRFIDQS